MTNIDNVNEMDSESVPQQDDDEYVVLQREQSDEAPRTLTSSYVIYNKEDVLDMSYVKVKTSPDLSDSSQGQNLNVSVWNVHENPTFPSQLKSVVINSEFPVLLNASQTSSSNPIRYPRPPQLSTTIAPYTSSFTPQVASTPSSKAQSLSSPPSLHATEAAPSQARQGNGFAYSPHAFGYHSYGQKSTVLSTDVDSKGTVPVLSSLIGGLGNEFPVYDGPSTASSLAESIVADKGLLNRWGENNCFLNGVLQVLWHNDTFRKKVLSTPHKGCTSNVCLYCQLQVMFTQMKFSSEQILPVNALRKTISTLYAHENRFQMYQMDDTAELLEAVLATLHREMKGSDELHSDITGCEPPCFVHEIFGTNIVEQIRCTKCQALSEPLSFTSFVHYFSVAALCEMAEQNQRFRASIAKRSTSGHPLTPTTLIQTHPGYSFSFLLNVVATGSVEICQSCQQKNAVSRTLLNLPSVLSLGLVWPSPNCDQDTVRRTMNLVQDYIYLQDAFKLMAPMNKDSTMYYLKGMVCYYGLHYVAFQYSRKAQQWMMFDDSVISPIGPTFEHVRDKCVRGRYQPSLLFFEQT